MPRRSYKAHFTHGSWSLHLKSTHQNIHPGPCCPEVSRGSKEQRAEKCLEKARQGFSPKSELVTRVHPWRFSFFLQLQLLAFQGGHQGSSESHRREASLRSLQGERLRVLQIKRSDEPWADPKTPCLDHRSFKHQGETTSLPSLPSGSKK